MSLLTSIQDRARHIAPASSSHQSRMIDGHIFARGDIDFLKGFTCYLKDEQDNWKDGRTYWHKDSFAQCGIGYRKVQDAGLRQNAQYEWVFHTTERSQDIYCTFDNFLMGSRFNSKFAMDIWRSGGRDLRDALHTICTHYPEKATAAYVVQLHDSLLANQRADWNIYDIINESSPSAVQRPASIA